MLDLHLEMSELETEYEQFNEEKLEAVKELLKPKVVALRDMQETIKSVERMLDLKKKDAHELAEEIRKEWTPFTSGADNCKLNLDGIQLEMRTKLNVKIEDQGAAEAWMSENGYKDVMKWQIHHSKLKSIATDLKENQDNPVEIPGLIYTKFNLIKVK